MILDQALTLLNPSSLVIKAGGFLIWTVLIGAGGFIKGCDYKDNEYKARQIKVLTKNADEEKKDISGGKDIVHGLYLRQEKEYQSYQIELANFQKTKGINYHLARENAALQIALGEQPSEIIKYIEKDPDNAAKICATLVPYLDSSYMRVYDSSFGEGNIEIRAGTDTAAREISLDEAWEKVILPNNRLCGTIFNSYNALLDRIELKQKTFSK